MIRPIAAIAASALAALSAGCASTPSHLYTLSPASTATGTADPSLSKLVIVIGSVSIPAIVDLPQIVVQNGANQVSVDEFNRWASPLRNNIALVVGDNLAALLGTASVSSVVSMDADYRVAIEVQTFRSAPGDAATLSALWTVRRVRDGKTETGRTSDREAAAGGYAALAAAHSRALGRLSADIADAIRALDRAG
ncbi:MAG TPA: PqiC family protein [Steroidobacteraceae bacterium]|nr:PqiC family protein [Steroidobacteraceae bacterium]